MRNYEERQWDIAFFKLGKRVLHKAQPTVIGGHSYAPANVVVEKTPHFQRVLVSPIGEDDPFAARSAPDGRG